MIHLVRVLDWHLCGGCRFNAPSAEPATVGLTSCTSGGCDNWAPSMDPRDDPGRLPPDEYERLRRMIEERGDEPGSAR